LQQTAGVQQHIQIIHVEQAAHTKLTLDRDACAFSLEKEKCGALASQASSLCSRECGTHLFEPVPYPRSQPIL